MFCRGENYRTPLKYAIDIMAGYSDCHYVADTRDGFENDPEDTKWVFEYFAPRSYAAGCQYIFFIIDQNDSLKEELEGQSVELSRYFTVKACYSMEEVSKELEEIRSTNNQQSPG
jgi:hypothetical protein